MQKVVIVKTEKGYTVAEVSDYTYLSEQVARAFARDKWGDESPSLAIEVPIFEEATLDGVPYDPENAH